MSGKSRTHYATLNMSVNLVGFAVNLVLGFICRIIFVRYLSAEYLGLSGLFTNLISMLSLAELGIGSAITYALYEPLAKNNTEKVKSLVAMFGSVYKIIGIVIAILGIAFIPFLDQLFNEPPKIKENVTFIYLLFLFSTSISYFVSHKINVFRAAQKDYLVTGSSYINTILQNVFQIAILVFTENYMYYLYLQVLFGIFYLVWIEFVFRKHYRYLGVGPAKPLTKEEKGNIFKNVWAISVQKLGGVLVNSTDNIIISHLISVVAVGLLSNYLLLVTTLQGLVSNLLLSATASIGNFNSLEKKSETHHLFFNIQFFLFVIYGWLAMIIFLISDDLVQLLFGKKYLMGLSISLILAINFYMVGMQSALWTFRTAMGLFNFKKYILLVTAVINIILSFALGKLWGVAGVLLATIIARLCTNWWYDVVVVFNHGMKVKAVPYFIDYFRYVLIVAVVGTLSYAILSFGSLPLLWSILLKLIVITGLFLLTIFLVFRKAVKYNYAQSKFLQMWNTLQNVFDMLSKKHTATR